MSRTQDRRAMRNNYTAAEKSAMADLATQVATGESLANPETPETPETPAAVSPLESALNAKDKRDSAVSDLMNAVRSLRDSLKGRNYNASLGRFLIDDIRKKVAAVESTL